MRVETEDPTVRTQVLQFLPISHRLRLTFDLPISIIRPRAVHSLHLRPLAHPKATIKTRMPSGFVKNNRCEHPFKPRAKIHQRVIPQLMIAEQDRTMDSISGTLTTLAQQAGLMGREIGQHNE